MKYVLFLVLFSGHGAQNMYSMDIQDKEHCELAQAKIKLMSADIISTCLEVAE